MSIIVQSPSEIDAMPDGTVVLVRGDDMVTVKEWVVEDGNLTLTDEDTAGPVSLPARSFRDPIDLGHVSAKTTHKVGDLLYDRAMSRFNYVVATTHDGPVWAVLNGSGTWQAFTNEDKTGEAVLAGNYSFDYPAITEHYRCLRDAERLASVLETGVIPAEEEVYVEVQVSGATEVTLTAEQAADLLADEEVTVTAPGATTVGWTRTVHILKDTRWGCACDQVDDSDIEAAMEIGGIQGWTVITCRP